MNTVMITGRVDTVRPVNTDTIHDWLAFNLAIPGPNKRSIPVWINPKHIRPDPSHLTEGKVVTVVGALNYLGWGGDDFLIIRASNILFLHLKDE